MKRVVFASMVLLVSITTTAQDVMDDGSRVILPLEAQQCDLPAAPPPIPDPATKEDLLSAQKKIKVFQADMETYRACINAEEGSDELSTGNRLAILNAHNYSVGMEERVAAIFNEALREYKANLPKD